MRAVSYGPCTSSYPKPLVHSSVGSNSDMSRPELVEGAEADSTRHG